MPRSTTALLIALAACSLQLAAPAPGGAVDTTTAPAAAPSTVTCGDGLLAGGETCATCAADCSPRPCAAGEKRQKAQLVFTAPKESLGGDVRSFTPVAATLTVAYRTDRVTLPGKATEPTLRARITATDSTSATIVANDLDYALHLVVADSRKLQANLATIELDACKDAPAALDADFACVVEACAGHGGPLADCYCKISLAAAPAPAPAK